jgi:nicotinamide-nucleotide amidase
VLGAIEERFKTRGIPMPVINKRMAMVPDKARVIPNQWGTAPGLLFETDHTLVWALPGVPSEMKGIMAGSVLPLLKEKAAGNVILHRTIQTFGLAESTLAERISDWESALPEYMSLAFLPAFGAVRLRLTALGSDQKALQTETDSLIGLLKGLIGDNIFSYEDRSLEELVGERLLANNLTLSTAESCTGGAISKQIVRVAGSSAYFKGSVVAYSYEAKEQMLGVPMALINKHGAVSEQCVVAMAQGARQCFQSDYAIATSGIAGPSGGTQQKPVGTVWMALAGPKGVVSKCFVFGKNREQNIERSVSAALHLLLSNMQ